ncbi:MAG: sulfurtransferase TusA family protein [Pseudomonadota bacterium]
MADETKSNENALATPASDDASTVELDARHLLCPLPILKAKQAMRKLNVGDVLKVQATDPNTPVDIRAFCEARGHNLVSENEADGVFTFWLKRGR